MKFMLNHLTGSLQGRTQYFDTDLLRIGTGEQCGLLFDAQKDVMVSPLHAEIVAADHVPIVRDRSGRDALLVNGRGTAEGLLSSGDLIQLGEGGPELRFRLLPDGTPEVKPWRDIVADSRDIVVRMPHARYMSPLYLTGHLVTEVIRYGSLPAKSIAVAVVLAPVLVIAGLGVALYHQYQVTGVSERRVVELISRIETGRPTRTEMEKSIERERESVTELRRQQEEIVAKLNAALKEQEVARRSQEEIRNIRQQLSALQGAQRFAEDIVRRFEKSVGLLQGGYGFKEKGTGRPLRYRGFDEQGNPLVDKDGNALVTVEGSEAPVVIDYAGTGFLVDKTGTIVTNRHMVRMWESFPQAQQAIEAGFEPDLHLLRMFFADVPEPYTLQVAALSDRADLAILRTDRVPSGIPALTLLPSEEQPRTGEALVVLSYPGSFDSILGRLAREVSEEVLGEAGADPVKLAQALARRGLVRPLATQGHISNVAPDVLTFEAGSGSGSSGSPIFDRAGRVIAVNRGSLRKSGGLNVAIPVRLVGELLAKTKTEQGPGSAAGAGKHSSPAR